jgi:rubredoxin
MTATLPCGRRMMTHHQNRGIVSAIDTMTTNKDIFHDEYQCGVCAYIYEPDAGDATSGTPPGTAWQALPDEWGCPHCGAPKAAFRIRPASRSPAGRCPPGSE